MPTINTINVFLLNASMMVHEMIGESVDAVADLQAEIDEIVRRRQAAG